MLALAALGCGPKRAPSTPDRGGWVVVLEASLRRDAGPSNDGVELAVASDVAKSSLSEWHAQGGRARDRRADRPIVVSDDALRTRTIAVLLPLVGTLPQTYSLGPTPSWMCDPEATLGPQDAIEQTMRIATSGRTVRVAFVWGGAAPPAPPPVVALLAVMQQTARRVAAGCAPPPRP
jgi:hypothetical protein